MTYNGPQAMRKWLAADPRRAMFCHARQRAKALGLPFTITLDDVVIPEVCPVFGVPMFKNDKIRDNSRTLDRIDNSIGYVPGNVQVISYKANRMKSNATSEELLQFTEWINKTFG